MFKFMKGSIATDRDGVHKDSDYNVYTYYFSPAEKNEHQQSVFELNDYVARHEMNLFYSINGE